MRHHDIERLKQAASRVNGFAGTLADFEELTDYAIDKLDEPSGVRKVDNGDGTTTFTGVSVTIPTSVASEYDVVAVRRPTSEDKAVIRSDGAVVAPFEHCIERVILTPRPTWKPPASLSDGDYKWSGSHFSKIGKEFCVFKSGGIAVMFRDWTDPPRCGLYKVESGTATWSGE